MGSTAPVLFETGLPLREVVHEGNGFYWANAVVDPARFVSWILIADGDVLDQVRTYRRAFPEGFVPVWRGAHVTLYARRDAPSATARRPLEEIVHFAVGGLREVVVEATDGQERLGRRDADDLVHLARQLVAGGGAATGTATTFFGRPLLADRRHRRAHRGPGGEAVVHQDHHGAATSSGGRDPR